MCNSWVLREKVGPAPAFFFAFQQTIGLSGERAGEKTVMGKASIQEQATDLAELDSVLARVLRSPSRNNSEIRCMATARSSVLGWRSYSSRRPEIPSGQWTPRVLGGLPAQDLQDFGTSGQEMRAVLDERVRSLRLTGLE